MTGLTYELLHKKECTPDTDYITKNQRRSAQTPRIELTQFGGKKKVSMR